MSKPLYSSSSDLNMLINVLRENVFGGVSAGAGGLWGWGSSFPGPEPGKMRELGVKGWGMWSQPPKLEPKRPPGREREERKWHRKL